MEDYFAAKRKLFDGSMGSPRGSRSSMQDDPYGVHVKSRICAAPLVYTYGLQQGDFHAEKLAHGAVRHALHHGHALREKCHSPPGSPVGVNVYNLLAAGAAAMARGLSLEEVAQGAASLDYVPGRFQSVDCGQNFAVVVDYAHTDDALRNIIAVAREFVDKGGGRVITMFGCGGDRDRSKRPLMGQAAGAGSDVVVLTSDNPRARRSFGDHRPGASRV